MSVQDSFMYYQKFKDRITNKEIQNLFDLLPPYQVWQLFKNILPIVKTQHYTAVVNAAYLRRGRICKESALKYFRDSRYVKVPGFENTLRTKLLYQPIFRGGHLREKETGHCLSWTLHPGVAEWFAFRPGWEFTHERKDTCVYTARIIDVREAFAFVKSSVEVKGSLWELIADVPTEKTLIATTVKTAYCLSDEQLDDSEIVDVSNLYEKKMQMVEKIKSESYG